MSIEQQLEALTSALQANTQALLGNAGAAPTQNTVTQAQTPAPVQNAALAPAQNAAAPVTPPAAATNVVASPSSTQPAMTLDQLKQEVTAIYQARNADPQVMATVQRYGNDLTAVAAEQYNNLITELRNLP